MELISYQRTICWTQQSIFNDFCILPDGWSRVSFHIVFLHKWYSGRSKIYVTLKHPHKPLHMPHTISSSYELCNGMSDFILAHRLHNAFSKLVWLFYYCCIIYAGRCLQLRGVCKVWHADYNKDCFSWHWCLWFFIHMSDICQDSTDIVQCVVFGWWNFHALG